MFLLKTIRAKFSRSPVTKTRTAIINLCCTHRIASPSRRLVTASPYPMLTFSVHTRITFPDSSLQLSTGEVTHGRHIPGCTAAATDDRQSEVAGRVVS